MELISGPFVIRWGYGPIAVNNLRLAQVVVCVNEYPNRIPSHDGTYGLYFPHVAIPLPHGGVAASSGEEADEAARELAASYWTDPCD